VERIPVAPSPTLKVTSHRASGRARQGDIDAVAIGGQRRMSSGCNLLVRWYPQSDALSTSRRSETSRCRYRSHSTSTSATPRCQRFGASVRLYPRPTGGAGSRPAALRPASIIDASSRVTTGFSSAVRSRRTPDRQRSRSVDHQPLPPALAHFRWPRVGVIVTVTLRIRRAGQGDAVGVVDQQWRMSACPSNTRSVS